MTGVIPSYGDVVANRGCRQIVRGEGPRSLLYLPLGGTFPVRIDAEERVYGQSPVTMICL